MSSDVPLSDEYITQPPALTFSPGGSEAGEDLGSVPLEVATVPLMAPPPRVEPRLLDLFACASDNETAQRWSRELLIRIYDLLYYTADRSALTYVDKGNRFLLTPKLYHTVEIDVSKYPRNLVAVTTLFCAPHPGRTCIKSVIFYCSSTGDNARPPPGCEYLASIAIENVPLYQLECFDWPADLMLASLYSRRLMTRQDELKNLQLYNTTISLRSNERKEIIRALNKIESLRISPDNAAGIRHVWHIIRQRSLQELHVDLRAYTPAQADLDYHHADSKMHDIVETLFRHAIPLTQCVFEFQLPLTRLVLWNVNLYRSSGTWLKIIRPMSLKEVELSRCAWAGNFLLDLAKMQPSIEKVKIFHDKALDDLDKAPSNKKYNVRFDKSLRGFLEDLASRPSSSASTGNGSTTSKAAIQKPQHGLKHLEIRIEHSTGGMAFSNGIDNGIGLHAATLEILALDFVVDLGSSIRHGGDMPVSRMINSCNPSTLRQLCVPETSFMHQDTDLRRINPVILMLVTWDKSHAQQLASEVLCKLQIAHGEGTRLRVLAVQPYRVDIDGVLSTTAVEFKGNNAPAYFVKCEATIMGRKTEVMMRVSYGELRKYERELDILEPTPAIIGKYGRA